MSDIVEELRDVNLGVRPDKHQRAVFARAIDEITRLRAELEAKQKDYEQVCGHVHAALDDYHDMKLRAEAAEAALQEMREALRELRDACKAEPAMNNMKYDSLGIRVNAALAEGEKK